MYVKELKVILEEYPDDMPVEWFSRFLGEDNSNIEVQREHIFEERGILFLDSPLSFDKEFA
jgi:hypothetical protein